MTNLSKELHDKLNEEYDDNLIGYTFYVFIPRDFRVIRS